MISVTPPSTQGPRTTATSGMEGRIKAAAGSFGKAKKSAVAKMGILKSKIAPMKSSAATFGAKIASMAKSKFGGKSTL